MPILGVSLTDVKTYGRDSLMMDVLHFGVAYGAAFSIHQLAKHQLKYNDDYRRHLTTAAASVGGGILSMWVLSRWESSSCLDEKFVKLYALQALFSVTAALLSKKSICLFVPLFGGSGYFGNKAVFYYEMAGAMLGAAKPYYTKDK